MRCAAFLICFFCLAAISPASADEVILGAAGPMTGGLAAFGEQIAHGISLASEDTDKEGGLIGRQLAVAIGDDACDPKQARVLADKMVTEKVPVVFGHWCAAASMAASGVYGEEGVLQIDVGGLLDNYTHQGYASAFRVSTTSKTYAKVLANYTIQHNPKANVAIVTDQPAVTKELTKDLQDYFAPTDNRVVAVEDIRSGDKDFSAVIDRLKNAQPQVVICSCYTIEAGLLARQMSEKGLNVYFYGWDTLNSPDFLAILSGVDTKKIVSIDYARAPKSSALVKLAAELRKRNWPLETTTVLTYAAFQVYAQAVKEANSFDVVKVSAVMHEKTFSTIIGDVKFDQFGDRIDPAFATYQWESGKLKETGAVSY